MLLLTLLTMLAEIAAGIFYGSMALLADGWHMGTHVAAFMITVFAYRYARKHAENPRFSFGTGKVGVLGGFASAVTLAVVAAVMAMESVKYLLEPQTIHFDEAIVVAGIGLSINLISALILVERQRHHDDDHHDHHHHDHNIEAAFFHVLADALTSVLAIAALLSGKYYGLNWLDPAMGILGALIIVRWSLSLLQRTGPILLDGSIEENYKAAIKYAIESDSDSRVSDLHVWPIGSSSYAAIIALSTPNPKPPEHYKALLCDFDKIEHITVEVQSERR
ncbi:MAG: CDF family Co(II)/Ni(II) efflux transporter DmeF [Methylomicrobium sp.]